MRDVICFQVEKGTLSADSAAFDAVKDLDFRLLRVLCDEFGARCTHRNAANGTTPLHWAAYRKCPDMMRYILARPEAADGQMVHVLTTDKGQTVAHFAAIGGDLVWFGGFGVFCTWFRYTRGWRVSVGFYFYFLFACMLFYPPRRLCPYSYLPLLRVFHPFRALALSPLSRHLALSRPLPPSSARPR